MAMTEKENRIARSKKRIQLKKEGKGEAHIKSYLRGWDSVDNKRKLNKTKKVKKNDKS